MLTKANKKSVTSLCIRYEAFCEHTTNMHNVSRRFYDLSKADLFDVNMQDFLREVISIADSTMLWGNLTKTAADELGVDGLLDETVFSATMYASKRLSREANKALDLQLCDYGQTS